VKSNLQYKGLDTALPNSLGNSNGKAPGHSFARIATTSIILSGALGELMKGKDYLPFWKVTMQLIAITARLAGP
jgi:hypothetical protein